MKSYLNIKISNLWKVFAIGVIAVIITCCGTIPIITQNGDTQMIGSTATVNQTITIDINLTYCNPYQGTATLIVGVLMPNGWQGYSNMTGTYTSNLGNGNMQICPSTLLENHSQLPWQDAITKKFGIGNNYISDMQWVVFESDKPYSINSIRNGDITFKLKVGADGNNADVNIGYFIGETNDGISNPDGNFGGGSCTSSLVYEYFANVNTDQNTNDKQYELKVTGGNGSPIDYAHPQVTTIDPSKALTDDLLTVNFYDNITPLTILAPSEPNIYFNATAYSAGTAYPVTDISNKTLLQETATGSNIYRLTFWPRSFFGLSDSQSLDSMKYVITDGKGNTIGARDASGNLSAAPVPYNFTCTQPAQK